MTLINWDLPLVWHIVAVLVAAALLHASFQVAVSVLTSLSARHLGFNGSHTSLLRLCASYVLGVFASVIALVLALAYIFQSLTSLSSSLLWASVSGYSAAIGVIVLLFYYREGRGTVLWLPRSIAKFLQNRTSKTSLSIESFSLGIMTVVAELPFILAPMAIVAMTLQGHTSGFRLLALAAYGIIAVLPLLLIVWLVGGGTKISRIQKWREANKGFLQFAAGAGLIVVSAYIFVTYCIGS